MKIIKINFSFLEMIPQTSKLSKTDKIIKAMSASSCLVENGKITYNYKYKNRSLQIKDTQRGRKIGKMIEENEKMLKSIIRENFNLDSFDFLPYEIIKDEFPKITKSQYELILATILNLRELDKN